MKIRIKRFIYLIVLLYFPHLKIKSLEKDNLSTV